jgi:enamine deaminase RidA (YjgF/YER057c/UK114 family)
VTLQLINPEGLPVPSTYTHVVIATGTTMVFIAGQEPEDAHGDLAGAGDLVHYRREHLPVIEQARQHLFGEHKPADVVVGVQRLARPEYLIEVDAIAVIDR